MSDLFYRAFEDEFRGSRELILERLQAYLPFIQPLQAHLGQYPALDLGCGRGEWLELARAQGYEAIGIDQDDGMLAACRERDLPVITADALQYLRAQPDDSHSLVTGFHIAEHLPFDDLRTLASEARRILRPGGLLILETPNPENLVIGTSAFHLDPTHRQPLPPLLLDFLARQAGFAPTVVMRLHASAEVDEGTPLTLMHVLGGASPDYAVVAQKGGAPGLEAVLAPAFARGYGPDLDRLAARYQQQLEQRFTAIDRQLDQARAELQAIYTSRSWRITSPLRRARSLWRSARELGLAGSLKALATALFRRR